MATPLTVSPLARPLPDLATVEGVRLSAVAAGIRYAGRTDLMLAEFVPGTIAAGVYTKNLCPGAPIDWCRQALKTPTARALLVNAGNANVFTGRAGRQTVEDCAEALAAHLSCPKDEIFLASTGVIGEVLPPERIINALPAAQQGLSADHWEQAARAIMTTDTFPKAARRDITIDGTPVRIQGIAKGSGMVAPDMATMLAYVMTDASLPQDVLQTLLSRFSQKSFNAITVDSDTSTSDMLMAFATQQAQHSKITDADAPALSEFRTALQEVLQELALLVVRDGEGATKQIRIDVTGATSDISAHKVALSVANSPLVKTAIAGEDANWGRVVMAVGKSGEPADRDTLAVGVGGVWIAKEGSVVPNYDETPVVAHMKGQEIDITVDLGLGSGSATVWTCDLTHGYIDINGSYRS
ncbi:N-acetylglutamate synthase [Neokomagataea thailandica NBRC 106555]|uniref:Arginine biosynthesis bifunctional protein ArgJ n=2 Tax=Neokomagataea TaxID=1223423 RepID=A0A4Y6V6P1_9PROT|nr:MULTISPECIES: bifunctional glutamate N-acetyltransferase/amino-acid acetyltransferase ArgJ [Neokomagataea]QDH24320.1 bifunctional glutamate N-acetyltransferase/amino-acid acetyltransferase ArgJ [Neokomagataea tanensis]GBR53139.1 N-acetylglutamate synthase [Neokomagataea thailandica NBRC 106555]